MYVASPVSHIRVPLNVFGLFVNITSTNDGLLFFGKQVGSFTIVVKIPLRCSIDCSFRHSHLLVFFSAGQGFSLYHRRHSGAR